MKAHRISVVIATYNRGPRIARTLDSVLAQSRPADEIVVIDDASPDKTGDWVRAHYPQVSVHTFPNGGTSVARNRGAEQASGDILVFIDHDDDMLANTIEVLTSLLDTFPAARAAYADHQLKNVVDNEFFPNHHTAMAAFARMRAIPEIERRGTARTYGLPMYRALLSGNLLQQPWAIYRRDFLDLGGFDPAIKYCEDWELYMRVTRSRVIAVTDTVISVHYIEGANLHRVDGQHLQHMKAIEKHIRLNRTDRTNAWILRRRLANYHKGIGDERRAAGEPGAWRAYATSLVTWPFDPIVWARTAWWGPSGLKELVRGR